MSWDVREADERTHLLSHVPQGERTHGHTDAIRNEEAAFSGSSRDEKIPYDNYAAIDWLRDLTEDSARRRRLRNRRGLRNALVSAWDSSSGWFVAALTGILTACVASTVDVSVPTVSDWKLGYCTTNVFSNRKACCRQSAPGEVCTAFQLWAVNYWPRFGIYVIFVLIYGVVSSSATMLTQATLPSRETKQNDTGNGFLGDPLRKPPKGKTIYMAAGSGIPEIKTILSGFVINNYLSLKVALVKAFGAVFAVSTGMCLGKEGPFVHISTCLGHVVASRIPKYRDSERKMRDILSVSCAAGMTVAFGAPIGGVLFSYEEISTYFPRKVLWRAFLCSLFAAIVLKELDPFGTGRLALFETNYGSSYLPIHYLVFCLLGVAGGVFGGLFCKLNFLWSRWFRAFPLIRQHPVFETVLVCAATALIQFPNVMTRDTGDVVFENLLVDCKGEKAAASFLCRHEAENTVSLAYVGWLWYGTCAKLFLTIITFGVKVPSGVIIPALDGGAFFGRLLGQWVGTATVSPGIFALVGASAFLAGVCRMTISLAVIMFELTGELGYIVPHMIGILIAKWIADCISREGVYDLAQTLGGHPFLDIDRGMSIVHKLKDPYSAEALIPHKDVMDEMRLVVPTSQIVPGKELEEKVRQLRRRGLIDTGLALLQQLSASTPPILRGYIGLSELEYGLANEPLVSARSAHSGFPALRPFAADVDVRFFSGPAQADLDLSALVDVVPHTVGAKAPLEYVVEMFGKLGLRHTCVLDEATGAFVGIITKERLIAFLEDLDSAG